MKLQNHNCIDCKHLILDNVAFTKFRLNHKIDTESLLTKQSLTIKSTCAKNVFRLHTHKLELLVDTQHHAASYIRDCDHYEQV